MSVAPEQICQDVGDRRRMVGRLIREGVDLSNETAVVLALYARGLVARDFADVLGDAIADARDEKGGRNESRHC